MDNVHAPTGPGTWLHLLLAQKGFKYRERQPCSRYRETMNLFGCGYCTKNLRRIPRWVRDVAAPDSPCTTDRELLPLIRQAIRRSKGQMELRNYFTKCFVVSMATHKDRWKRFKQNCPSDWPFAPVRRYDAIVGKLCKRPDWWCGGGGAWGCYRSHLRIIEDALNNGWESVLLMEDDAVFPADFTQRVTEFLKHVPDDWGMLYLGGQHLCINQQRPTRINDYVYQPYNVNRTHCFALRGDTMRAVYKHLCRKDWTTAHHIDHHLGRFHQRRDHPIYCPKEWLVGQAEGWSNVAGRKVVERYWQPAELIANYTPDSVPFCAVIGLHSSGSSALAGVLYHLGVHLGNDLTGYWGRAPVRGGEAVALAKLCEDAIPFPLCEYKLRRDQIWNRLRSWINQKRREAYFRQTVPAGKYPQLCRMSAQLLNICGDNLRVLHIDRPLEACIESIQRRTANKQDPQAVADHQRWLQAGKEQLLKQVPEQHQLTVQFHDLLHDTEAQIARIVQFLELSPTPQQLKVAADYPRAQRPTGATQ